MAKIAINNLTSVDYAYIAPDGQIRGDSFNVNVILSGEPTNDEHVVVDFGTAKKEIKALIDHPQTGFDHKLWVDPRWVTYGEVEGTVCVKTPFVNLVVPTDALNICDVGLLPEYLISGYLNSKLPYTVEVTASTEPTVMRNYETDMYDWSEPVFFNYVHGLKDSSSWGCQNLAHGHLSFLQILWDERMNPFEVARVTKYLAESSQNAIFIKKENVVENTCVPELKTFSTKVEYSSNDRGVFKGTFSVRSDLIGQSRVCILDTETTIEYLVEEFARTLQSICKEDMRFIKAIFVSEGLNKGAIYEF